MGMSDPIVIQAEQYQRNLWLGVQSVTTSAGNAGGTTLVDSARTEAADFWNDHYSIIILDGANAGEIRQIVDHDGTDTITVGRSFTAQVASGVNYVIKRDPYSIQGANSASNSVDTSAVTGDVDGSLAERIEATQAGLGIVAAAGDGFEEDGTSATLYNTLISHKGITTSAGTTTTIVSTGLSGYDADDLNGVTVVMLENNSAGLPRTIVDFDGTSTITVEPALPDASSDASAFIILNQKGVDWIIGDNNANNAYLSDLVAPNSQGSVLERLEYLQSLSVVGEGTFTTSSATVPADTSHSAKATGWFNGCILLPTAGVVAYQPRLITLFTTTTGVFTVDSEHPFTAATGLVDYVVLSNEADLVPAVDSTASTTAAHVIGNKADSIPAMNSAPNSNDSIVRIVKAVLERLGATPADPDDSVLTVIGQRDAAATNDTMSDITTTDLSAKARLILNRMSTGAFTADIQGTARTELDIMLAQIATYFVAAGAAMSLQVNNQTARTNLQQALSDYFTVVGCDGTNIFNPTIQGSARTTVDDAFAQIATYFAAAGAAMSIQLNNQTARTNLEQVLEDYFTLVGVNGTNVLTNINGSANATFNAVWQKFAALWGADGANVFDPAMFGGSQLTLETAIAALGTAFGVEFDGSPDVYDVLYTGVDSTALAANANGSISEMLKAIIVDLDLTEEVMLADYDDFAVADADANNERWNVAYLNGTEGGSADINTTTAGKLMVKVDPDASPTAAMYGVYTSQSVVSKYATWIVDLDATLTGTQDASSQSAGMEVSELPYSLNNRVYIQKQNRTAGERITTGAIFAGGAETEAHYTTDDDAIALKIERRDNVWRTYYSLSQSPDYVWVMLGEYEDTGEDIAAETACYLEAYSPGNTDDRVSQGDFDNWKVYIALKGAAQMIAGDYDSTHIAANDNGCALERLEALKDDIDAILADTNELQTDWTNGGRLDLIIDELTAQGDTNEGKLDTIDTVVDNNQDYLDGTTATPNAYRREYGVTQVFEASITAAANAGVTTVATITTQPCLIKSVVIHADAAQTADMTSCAVKAGTGQVVTIIEAADAIQANLNAADKQVSSGPVEVRLAATKTVVIDLQGTGATAVDLTVTVEYMACVDGGYLA